MTAAKPAIRALIACLRGQPPDRADWLPVVETANRCWLTPALYSALARASQLDALPDDVRAYCAFIHERNLERNRRLLDQLTEAVRSLNRAGIEPTLLKGAAILFPAPDDRAGSRMMCDLDLMVSEEECRTAEACLGDLGYQTTTGVQGQWRPDDTGMVELHYGRGAFSAYYPSHDLAHGSSCADRMGARAKLPSPTCQALHLIVHDQIKDGDYWRGTVDLRHLHDLATLSDTPEGIDWRRLEAILSDRLGRHALDTQLLTLHRLFGTPVPAATEAQLVARLQHRRCMVQMDHPVLGAPLRFLGAVAWVLRRMRMGEGPDPLRVDFLWRVLRKLPQGRHATTQALLGFYQGPKL